MLRIGGGWGKSDTGQAADAKGRIAHEHIGARDPRSVIYMFELVP